MIFARLGKIQISVENFFNGVAAAIVVFMMGLTTVDVVMRYVFNSPIPDVYNLCEMLIVGIVYLAIAYVQQQKSHVRVDVIIDRLQGPPRLAFELGTLILALVGFSLMTWQAGRLAWDAWVTGDYSMGLIEYPFWPSKFAMTLGIGLLCLRFVTDIKHYAVELKKTSPHWILWLLVAFLPLGFFAGFLGVLSPGQFPPVTVGWILLLAMIVVLFIGLPVAFGLLIVGTVGYWVLAGADKTFLMLGSVPYSEITSYPLTVVPLFILMGNLAYQAGFAQKMYETAEKWVGSIPGGLAQATIVGGAAFGAACGSGLASCATLAKICIPPMRKAGVDDRLALGSVAGAGPIAQMIPPSIVMVVYGFITDTSIGKLLIAGIIPGLIAAGVFMVMIYVRCRLNPRLASAFIRKSFMERAHRLVGTQLGHRHDGAHRHGRNLQRDIHPHGGRSAGRRRHFDPRLAQPAVNLAEFPGCSDGQHQDRRHDLPDHRRRLSLQLLHGNQPHSVESQRIYRRTRTFLAGVILFGVLVLYIIAGCFIDMLAFAFLTLPVIFPVIKALGYDPIWFGVITTHMFEVALITPPFGLNLFIIRSIVPDKSMKEIIQGVGWFVAMDMVTLAFTWPFRRWPPGCPA